MTLREFSHAFAGVVLVVALLAVDSDSPVPEILIGLLVVAGALVGYAERRHLAVRGHWWRYREEREKQARRSCRRGRRPKWRKHPDGTD